MKVDEFVKKLKEAKLTQTETAFFNVKVKRFDDGVIKIYKEEKCKYCKVVDYRAVEISFHKEHTLTIFEAGLLYALYILNKKPKDYANFHKCIAGKRFIENIKSIYVM